MIRKIQHYQRMHVKSYNSGYKQTHTELHLITTYYFLFIPIMVTKKLLSSNI
jgi:hypothetical protein